MIKHDKNSLNLFINWLSVSLILVFFMIIIGGLTRLTNSGLSITEWELFKGILPPLTNEQWYNYFSLYKDIPQYNLVNFNMTLEEFKVIFYWEYFHRILGRFIGLFFLLPLVYFYFSKKIDKKILNQCTLIFFLIFFQGIIGWYMVQSGLVNDITVSHYRLSLHLITALIIISSLYWLIINLKRNTFKYFFKNQRKFSPILFLIFIIFLQIILGAFVSGLDAGKIYQTWPLMGQTYFPDDILLKGGINMIDFNNHSLVQFYHRNLAYLIFFYVLGLSIYIYYKKEELLKPLGFLIFFLFLQILLGVITLISGLNIYLASGHQIVSVLLVFSAINLYYFNIK